MTVDELKALVWSTTMHVNGRGFSIHNHKTTVPDGRTVHGWRRTGNDPGTGFWVDGHQFDTLAQVAAYLSLPFTAGDDKAAAPD